MSAPVHLDHAGASRPSAAVVEEVTEHLELEATVGGYRAQTLVTDRLDQVRDDVATLVGTAVDEVALVENATRGWTLAVGTAATSWQPGERVLVSRAEFGSCRRAVDALTAGRGVRVETIPDDRDGHLDVDALTRMLDGRVRMVALTHVASHVGTVHPVSAAAQVVRDAGALVVVDAAQSIGQLPVDLTTVGADVLVGTSRKFLRGPRGVGILAVRCGALPGPPPLPELLHDDGETGWRDDAIRFETTEVSVALRLGLGVAVRHVLDIGVERVRDGLGRRRRHLRDALAAAPGVDLVDPGHDHAATVAFRVRGAPAEQVRDRLSAEGIVVSVARPTQTPAGFDRPLPVLRASVHLDTNPGDIARLVEALDSR